MDLLYRTVHESVIHAEGLSSLDSLLQGWNDLLINTWSFFNDMANPLLVLPFKGAAVIVDGCRYRVASSGRSSVPLDSSFNRVDLPLVLEEQIHGARP